MRALYLESVAGIAGDMFAASFVDAGLVTEDELRAIPARLGLDGVRVEISRPIKALMKTTHLNVKWENENWKRALGQSHGGGHTHANILNPKAGAEHWHTHYAAIDRFLGESKLDAPTRKLAQKVFRLIAEAEAEAHGMPVEEVAFHEIGAVDSIVDVVMAAHCVAKVGAEKIMATPVKLGRGLVTIEHGTHPIPPPASIRLVQGMPVEEVPAAITRPNVELSTPTGLAILKALAPSWVKGIPAGIVRAQGMGAGTMDLGNYPNVFRVSLMDLAQTVETTLPYESDRVVEIACNMDDETAERTAWVMENLMSQGALDVWVTPVTGKKGRAAVQLSVLAAEENWQKLADWLLRHSSTFGLRYKTWDRLKLAREFETRQTAAGPVTYKIGRTTNGEKLKEKPEYEDVRKLWDNGFKP